ncbi:hypothetical protein TWF506_000254 [Arthrobotrys conoides]|uniref:Uncharacterized protein n=1 Tax=Arthrobotrys conoides TaxID=74498 RepID=A0AAN8S445_9PEZI
MGEYITKESSSVSIPNPDPTPPEATSSLPKNATTPIVDENITTHSDDTTETAVEATKTSTPIPKAPILALTHYEKIMNWLCALSDQFCVVKMFARILHIHVDKLDLPLSPITREELRK